MNDDSNRDDEPLRLTGRQAFVLWIIASVVGWALVMVLLLAIL